MSGFAWVLAFAGYIPRESEGGRGRSKMKMFFFLLRFARLPSNLSAMRSWGVIVCMFDVAKEGGEWRRKRSKKEKKPHKFQIREKKTRKKENVLWTISNLDIAILRSIPSFILNLMMSIKKVFREALSLLLPWEISNEEIHKKIPEHVCDEWCIARARTRRYVACMYVGGRRRDLMGENPIESKKLLTWITHNGNTTQQ